jgi:site-specific recombinase XerD
MQQLSKLSDDADSRFEWLTLEQVRLILSLPDPTTRYGIRDLAYLSLLYDSGARNGEILGLRIEDVYMDNQCSIHVTGKGEKHRNIPISGEVAEILKCYLDIFHTVTNKKRWLFYTSRHGVEGAMSADNTARIMEKYEQIARRDCSDLAHLHPHIWRHTRSMHLYKAGMPLPLLSEWLGHAQLETTLIYAHADTEMKRKAIEAAMKGEELVVERQVPVYDDEEIIKRLYALA